MLPSINIIGKFSLFLIVLSKIFIKLVLGKKKNLSRLWKLSERQRFKDSMCERVR